MKFTLRTDTPRERISANRGVAPDKLRISVNGFRRGLALRIGFGSEAVAKLGLIPGVHLVCGQSELNELCLVVWPPTRFISRKVVKHYNGGLSVSFAAHRLGIRKRLQFQDYPFVTDTQDGRVFLVVRSFHLPAREGA